MNITLKIANEVDTSRNISIGIVSMYSLNSSDLYKYKAFATRQFISFEKNI